MTTLRFSLCVIFLLLLLFLMQYHLWFMSGGIRDLFSLKKQLVLQQTQNAQLKQQENVLIFQIQRLRQDKDQAEERARNELGMIKQGERFYQIIK